MKWNHLTKRFRYHLQYFPLTLNFFIIAIAFGVCWHYLQKDDINEKEANTLQSYVPLIKMMGKIALLFVAALLLLSILSAISCWLYYMWLRKKKKFQLELSFENTKRNNVIVFEAMLQQARRPLLGFIKGNLFYDSYEKTDTFLLASNKKKKGNFWREAVRGKSLLQLTDIKEYAVKGGFIFFEDMLQLVSLPVRQKINNHFYQPPVNLETGEQEVFPLKTETDDVRIEQLRRIDGDYINYKDFESGDDVRRIVWKFYAKNKELVVRIPEIFNPYASEIYLFASFHTAFNGLQSHNAFAQAMLNYYKNAVWTVYQSLSKKEFEIVFAPDNNLHIPEQTSRDAYVQRLISNSNWQHDLGLQDYFKPKYGSVLCISSMNSPQEIEAALEQANADTLVYFMKLSDVFKSASPLSLFWRLFLKSPEDLYKRIRGRWFFSPFRLRLLKQEKEIEKIIESVNVRIGTV